MTDHFMRMSLLALSADLGMSRLERRLTSKSTPRSDSSVKSCSVQNALCVPVIGGEVVQGGPKK